MKIGVFDSGVGGLSVAKAIERELPEHEVVFRHDSPEHFPYATKTPDELFGYVVPVVQSLVDDGCQVVLIACNTVTTTLILRLREHFSTPLIAVEPMVKPAAELTKSGVIAVCATPTTLTSPRYGELKRLYAQGVTVLEPDCADWSVLIEHNTMNQARLREEIEPVLEAGADVIVLGCTHYHWIKSEIQVISGDKAEVIQPENAIITELKRAIAQLV
ncbi:aspartate/glutamate racemase family protein [Candidatus Saccharibacteria bacterium]|nr:MAG: aspartate/glutamate racemase family protein [Candidatus Saccharibacteria bacterium]